MEAVLYAEIYLICIIITAVMLYWTKRHGMQSSAEEWLSRVLICFILNFTSNFLFTLFHRIYVSDTLIPSYILKTLYHLTLVIGVFVWCAYAELQIKSRPAEEVRKRLRLLFAASLVPCAVVIVNLWTHHLFYFDEARNYVRSFMFQFEMAYLLVFSFISAAMLIKSTKEEADPSRRAHLLVASTFPVCVAASWILSFVGEAFPVICVSITIELLFLFLGTTVHQISMDNLTQVNNRQNLIGFMNHKLTGHSRNTYLMMMDIDYFKSINDTYGHLEGDNALIKVSAGLKAACGSHLPRPYIARYGGDEFIVVAEAEDDEQLNGLVKEIKKKIKEKNAGSNYPLEVSIGIASWEPGMTTRELIDEADKALYNIKKGRNKGEKARK